MRRALAAVLALLAPAAAEACAVCGVGGDPNKGSFLATTVFLSLLPLAMLAAGLLFLRRAARQRRAEAVGPAAPALTPDVADARDPRLIPAPVGR